MYNEKSVMERQMRVADAKVLLPDRNGSIMMKKWNKLGMVCMMAAVLLMTACGFSDPKLTEEQNSQIVEYAAGLLLKYDENYHDRLAEREEAEEDAVQLTTEMPVAEPEEENTQEDMSEETEIIDASEEQETVVERSIEEFYGIDGVTISYAGYELKDSYPDTEGEDLVFAMNATANCKLLVMNFNVANISGQDLNLDMVALESKFRVSINGASPKYVLTTMLMNDLESYIGTIPAGASENLVLVSEIPEEEAGSVETITLLMRNATEEGRLTLN